MLHQNVRISQVSLMFSLLWNTRLLFVVFKTFVFPMDYSLFCVRDASKHNKTNIKPMVFLFFNIKSICTQYQYTVSVHSISTQYQCRVSVHSINTLYQYTVSVHSISISTQYQYTVSVHSISTQYQYTVSIHSISILGPSQSEVV